MRPRHLEPVDAGQHQVEQDQIGGDGFDRLERRFAVTEPRDLVAGVRQLELDEAADGRIVLDDQDLRAVSVIGPSMHRCFP